MNHIFKPSRAQCQSSDTTACTTQHALCFTQIGFQCRKVYRQVVTWERWECLVASFTETAITQMLFLGRESGPSTWLLKQKLLEPQDFQFLVHNSGLGFSPRLHPKRSRSCAWAQNAPQPLLSSICSHPVAFARARWLVEAGV